MKVAGVFQGTPIRGGHNRGVCVRLQPRNTHIYTHNSAQNSTSTQVTCLWFLQPTANFFSSPFSSSSSSFSLCLSTTFSRRMEGGGPKDTYFFGEIRIYVPPYSRLVRGIFETGCRWTARSLSWRMLRGRKGTNFTPPSYAPFLES